MVSARHDGRTATIRCTDCGAEMPDDLYARRFRRCARHADAEQAGDLERDVCDRCGSCRVPEDDNGLHWKTVRERRVCRTCVFELVLATAQTERWWTSPRSAR